MGKAGYGAQKGIAAAGWTRVLFYAVQFTWGLPVNLIGLLVFLCCRIRFPSQRFHNSIVICLPGNHGGMSLGVFIFLSVPDGLDNSSLCAHEYGHTIQCLFLGPLYWVVVALPSVIWRCLFERYRKKRHIAYDALYCERWATAWGKNGVEGGDKVQLVGFGTFEMRERSARTGRNPRTNEVVEIPAAKVPAFKAGKALKEKIQ